MRPYALFWGILSVLMHGHLTAQQERPIFNESIKVVHAEELNYPPLARQAHVRGVVVIRASLNKEGQVESAGAISGPKLLIEPCVDNVKRWTFQPGVFGDVIIIYDFEVQGVCQFGSPCPTTFRFRSPNVATIIAGGQPVSDIP